MIAPAIEPAIAYLSESALILAKAPAAIPLAAPTLIPPIILPIIPIFAPAIIPVITYSLMSSLFYLKHLYPHIFVYNYSNLLSIL